MSTTTTDLAVRPAAAVRRVARPAPQPKVERSVRHLMVCAGALAAAAAAGTGVSGLALHQHIELSKWLLVIAGILATFTLVAVADMAREGRHWRYAEDLGPAKTSEKG